MEVISTQPEAIAFLKAVFVSWATPSAIVLGILVHAYEVKSARDKWKSGLMSLIALANQLGKNLKTKVHATAKRISAKGQGHSSQNRWSLLGDHLSHG